MLNTETALVMIGTGGILFVLGMVVMMDRALMVAGNIVVIAGLAVMFKTNSLAMFETDKLIGSSMFLLGIFSLFVRYTLLGFSLELLGLLYILKRSLPSFRSLLMRLVYGKIVKIG